MTFVQRWEVVENLRISALGKKQQNLRGTDGFLLLQFSSIGSLLQLLQKLLGLPKAAHTQQRREQKPSRLKPILWEKGWALQQLEDPFVCFFVLA